MTLSTNNFADARPTKSTGSFADALSVSTNSFANAMPTADNHVWEGDDVSGSVYGGDYGTFGDLYGQGQYGGFTHFLNRTPPPAIPHG